MKYVENVYKHKILGIDRLLVIQREVLHVEENLQQFVKNKVNARETC